MLIIKQRRLQLNLTQAELAEMVGVTKSSICNIEKNNRKPSFSLMLRLAEVLNVPGDELLQDVDNSSFSQL